MTEKKKEKSFIDQIFRIKSKDEEAAAAAKAKIDQEVKEKKKKKVVANVRGTKIYADE